MIDNPKQVATLIEKLKAHLPIPAKATDALISALRNSATRIAPDAQIDVVDVMYAGDEGGICCTLKVAGQEKAAVVVSLTHLRLPNANPLSADVRAYQTSRTKKLARNR